MEAVVESFSSSLSTLSAFALFLSSLLLSGIAIRLTHSLLDRLNISLQANKIHTQQKAKLQVEGSAAGVTVVAAPVETSVEVFEYRGEGELDDASHNFVVKSMDFEFRVEEDELGTIDIEGEEEGVERDNLGPVNAGDWSPAADEFCGCVVKEGIECLERLRVKDKTGCGEAETPGLEYLGGDDVADQGSVETEGSSRAAESCELCVELDNSNHEAGRSMVESGVRELKEGSEVDWVGLELESECAGDCQTPLFGIIAGGEDRKSNEVLEGRNGGALEAMELADVSGPVVECVEDEGSERSGDTSSIHASTYDVGLAKEAAVIDGSEKEVSAMPKGEIGRNVDERRETLGDVGDVKSVVCDDEGWEGIERSELEKDFARALNFVEFEDKAAGRLVKASGDVVMHLYGLQKAALEGPCHEPQPMALKLSSRAKWDAWQKVSNMTPAEAMEQYITLLSDTVPGWRIASHHKMPFIILGRPILKSLNWSWSLPDLPMPFSLSTAKEERNLKRRQVA